MGSQSVVTHVHKHSRILRFQTYNRLLACSPFSLLCCKNTPFLFDSNGNRSPEWKRAFDYPINWSCSDNTELSRRKRLISANGIRWQPKVIASNYLPLFDIDLFYMCQLIIWCAKGIVTDTYGSFTRETGRTWTVWYWLTEVCSPQMMAWYIHLGRKLFICRLKLHLNSWRLCCKW